MNEISWAAALQLSPLWSLSLAGAIPLTWKILRGNSEPHSGLSAAAVFAGIAVSATLFLALGFNDQSLLSLKFGQLESGACLLAALAAVQCLPLFRNSRLLDKSQFSESLFLFSNSLTGLYIFCLSQDLMTAFIGLETASLSLYLLMAFAPGEKLSLEASIKYFVLSSFAGVLFLYGMSFVFGAAGGDLTIAGLAAKGNEFQRFFFLGLALLLSGLLFKISAFPFQFWLPEVYHGALTPVASFMATGLKASVILWTARFFHPVFSSYEKTGALLVGLAAFSALTILFGNILALRQTGLKRLAAFSSLSHSGYLLAALAGVFSLEEPDFFPLVFYLTAYVFMTGGAFACAQYLESAERPSLQDMKGLFRSNPLFALFLSFFLLGLAGAPPFFGFFAKAALLRPLIESGLYSLALWIVCASAVAFYYYMKPVALMCAAPQKPQAPLAPPASLHWGLPAFCAAGALCGAFFF